MIKEGIVQLICSNMKEMLKHLPRDMNCDKVKKSSNDAPVTQSFS
jgi:hypothetical protein